jgi:hypothetical protein
VCGEWLRASMKTDDAWLEENVAESFRYVMAGGTVERKQRVLAINREITNKHYALIDVISWRLRRRASRPRNLLGTGHHPGRVGANEPD